MDIREQLIRDEGLMLKPYRDTHGLLTIGVGRNLDAKGISHEEAMTLLDNDISEARAKLVKVIPGLGQSLDTIRFYALVNLAFNIGANGVLGFRKMLDALRLGDYTLAAAELLDSKYAKQVGDRARRLAKQLKTGEWQ